MKLIDLSEVFRNFERRAQSFLTLLAAAKAQSPKARDGTAAYVSLELETAIGYVVRTSYLAGCVGGYTKSGRYLSPVYSADYSALLDAAKTIKKNPVAIPGRDEPSWASVNHLSTVLGQVTPSNYSDLIGTTGAFIRDRRAVKQARNFYAHRGEYTWKDLRDSLSRDYGLTLSGHPSHELFYLNSGRPPYLLEEWVWNYLDVAEIACG